jgi:hypothetical protein
MMQYVMGQIFRTIWGNANPQEPKYNIEEDSTLSSSHLV